MDINDLRGLATIVVMTSFFAICWWAYIYKSKEDFREAEQLPFVDESPVGETGAKKRGEQQ